MDSSGDGAAGSGGGVNVNVRTPSGSKFVARISLDSTVGSLKQALSPLCDVAPEQQRLIYKGQILKNDQTLRSYGIEADHAVHLVRGCAPSAAANTASAINAGNENSTQAGDVGYNGGWAFAGSGNVSGMGGTGDLFGSGFSDLTRDLMNMPLFDDSTFNSDMVQLMTRNNPQMRDVIDRNPELRHVLNDPATIRQSLEAARNPELMREMMRNSDRAISNIEASPEGFNMLRRMYENVQEPLLNASTALLVPQGDNPTRSQSTNSSDVSSDSATNHPAPNTVPLPNPWSPTGGADRAGLGYPEFEGTLGAMQDTSLLNQAVQNPAVSELMQNFFSNPQNMDQDLGSDPQLRSLLDSNSFYREMLQNPEFLRQLASPETLQTLLTLLHSLFSLRGAQQQQSTQESDQTGGGTGSVDSMGLEMLMPMFGGLGTGSPAIPNRPNVPPEELYAAQLSQLQEMGFFDRHENIQALMTTAGNVHAAVERLLGNSGR